MLKKIAFVVCAYFMMVLAIVIVSGHLGDATAALYQQTMRWVNSSGFVIDGTASAVTASYNQTCQVVSSTGTVLDPGTASAVTASPNCTIRVVDHTNKVIDSFSAAPTAAPTPVARNGNTIATAANPVVTLPATVVNQDVCVAVCAGSNAAPTSPFPLQWWLATPTVLYSAGAGNWDFVYSVQNSQPASSTLNGCSGPVCQECYTNTHGVLDVAATSSNAAATTAVLSHTITTLSNNSLIVTACVDTNGTGTTTWGSPTRGTLRQHIDTVAGVTRGCTISDEVLATAGTSTAVGYTLSGNADYECATIAIEQ